MGRRYGQSITDRETQQAAHQIRHQHRAYPCGSEMRKSLDKSDAPVIGVAPIIAGRALKGPTAKMMREFGMQHRAAAVVRHSATFSTPISSADAESSDNSRSMPWRPKRLMLTLPDRGAPRKYLLAPTI